jgi:hypothetical protein
MKSVARQADERGLPIHLFLVASTRTGTGGGIDALL